MVQENMNRSANPADPVLDQAIVLRLVRQHLRSASAVTTIDETGGEARAYVIDDKYIFKTQRPHRVRERTSIEKAVFFERILAKDLPEVSVPRVLGYGREGNIEYVLETRMSGVAVRNVTLNGPARRGQLRIDLLAGAPVSWTGCDAPPRLSHPKAMDGPWTSSLWRWRSE